MDISIIKDEPNLEDLDLVNKKLIYFKSLNINNLPNLLFKGVSGSGKTTQINALLCTLLDKRIYQLTNRKVEIDKKEFKFLSSIFHLEIDICDFIGNERIFFNHYLKDYKEYSISKFDDMNSERFVKPTKKVFINFDF